MKIVCSTSEWRCPKGDHQALARNSHIHPLFREKRQIKLHTHTHKSIAKTPPDIFVYRGGGLMLSYACYCTMYQSNVGEWSNLRHPE